MKGGLINHNRLGKMSFSFQLETTNGDQRGDHPSTDGTITENGLPRTCKHPPNEMFSN